MISFQVLPCNFTRELYNLIRGGEICDPLGPDQVIHPPG
jgi:hypothetical protein